MKKFALYWPPQAKPTELPTSPFVALVVGSHPTIGEEIALTSHLMTEKEVDLEVDAMIRELEELRRSAKRKLKSLRST